MGMKECRVKTGFTQEKIADILGTSRVTISRWESGASEPSFNTLRTLKKIYNCSLDDLLNPPQPSNSTEPAERERAKKIA